MALVVIVVPVLVRFPLAGYMLEPSCHAPAEGKCSLAVLLPEPDGIGKGSTLDGQQIGRCCMVKCRVLCETSAGGGALLASIGNCLLDRPPWRHFGRVLIEY